MSLAVNQRLFKRMCAVYTISLSIGADDQRAWRRTRKELGVKLHFNRPQIRYGASVRERSIMTWCRRVGDRLPNDIIVDRVKATGILGFGATSLQDICNLIE